MPQKEQFEIVPAVIEQPPKVIELSSATPQVQAITQVQAARYSRLLWMKV